MDPGESGSVEPDGVGGSLSGGLSRCVAVRVCRWVRIDPSSCVCSGDLMRVVRVSLGPLWGVAGVCLGAVGAEVVFGALGWVWLLFAWGGVSKDVCLWVGGVGSLPGVLVCAGGLVPWGGPGAEDWFQMGSGGGVCTLVVDDGRRGAVGRLCVLVGLLLCRRCVWLGCVVFVPEKCCIICLPSP